MRQHLLRVEQPAAEYAELIAAVRDEELWVGWLELAEATPDPLPSALAEAAELDVLRAVAVGAGRSVAVKPMRGQPVLRDLLREHFRGCTLVLIRGAVDSPFLEPWGHDWRVTAGGEARGYTTVELIAALRRPRPWDSQAAGS
jgi:hypothetical protein